MDLYLKYSFCSENIGEQRKYHDLFNIDTLYWMLHVEFFTAIYKEFEWNQNSSERAVLWMWEWWWAAGRSMPAYHMNSETIAACRRAGEQFVFISTFPTVLWHCDYITMRVWNCHDMDSWILWHLFCNGYRDCIVIDLVWLHVEAAFRSLW